MRPAFGGPHRIAGETGRRGARRSRGMRSGFERGSSRIHAALGARRRHRIGERARRAAGCGHVTRLRRTRAVPTQPKPKPKPKPKPPSARRRFTRDEPGRCHRPRR
ncbi:hypothetical protein BOC52_12555 [Burkholderia pseudomallei]|nr:hypothetical protein BOC52_12555 [Burkholderia pseudomallei]ARL64037.1 hypothetical protein BOC53_11610 [Burkholderia pseudomallei]